jgi:hypothetical protein
MSNTPRTDAAAVDLGKVTVPINGMWVGAPFARQLERENTDLLEKLRAATSMPCAPSATAAPDRPDWARQLPGAEIFDRSNMKGEPVDHGYDRTASLNEGRYVCTCGACSHYDAQQPSHTTGEKP